jgi:uncharacterized membrane protein YkvA (DUF1232 family)
MRSMPWLEVLLISVAALLASWGVLVLFARRLPPGVEKDLAGILPACATTMWRLRNDPNVPRRAKAALAFAGLWVLSPIDLIPEFLPVIGPLDDVVVVALALRYAARQVPRGFSKQLGRASLTSSTGSSETQRLAPKTAQERTPGHPSVQECP